MAILVSILLAFAIDASWDARLEQARTESLLEALEQEWALDLVARVALELDVESSFESPAERMNTTLGVVPPDALVDAMFNDDEVLRALAHRYQISVIYAKRLGDVRTALIRNLESLRSELRK